LIRRQAIVPGIRTISARAIILPSQHFWIVATPQVATAIAGAAIGPAVNTMTLGIVKQAGFIRQNGIDQTFNHAGNLAGARSHASWRKEEPLARLADFLCSAAGARDRRGGLHRPMGRLSDTIWTRTDVAQVPIAASSNSRERPPFP
jgi:hypothetical protein